jgi:hypothetical protein
MKSKLHYNTISNLLGECLEKLMKNPLLSSFRLVGGTALSLQMGHRMSVDIDLFTDEPYGSVNFEEIESFLQKMFPYFEKSNHGLIGFGTSYFIGNDKQNNIKLDIYYTDIFIQKPVVVDHIRLASIEEIIAMKIDVISREGRKKDFWDLHVLMDKYTFNQMLDLHLKRHPYSHNRDEIKTKFIDFTSADDDFDPICLKNNYWELVKLDLIDFVNSQ